MMPRRHRSLVDLRGVWAGKRVTRGWPTALEWAGKGAGKGKAKQEGTPQALIKERCHMGSIIVPLPPRRIVWRVISAP
eukprot:611688-Pelagomonas_calceolata.AAC.1